MTATNERAVLTTFAELFAYPRHDAGGAARRCLALLDSHAAAAPLRKFAHWASQAASGEIEELYSATFDLTPTCPPYVGHYICPEPARRNLFLSALAAVYSGEGFQPSEELGDHVAEVLRFLAVARDGEARGDLLREGLVPALQGMKSTIESGNPYRWLIEALYAFAEPRARKRGRAREEVRP